jgi:hypothetical protein
LAAATSGAYLDQLKALSPLLTTVLGAMERLCANGTDELAQCVNAKYEFPPVARALAQLQQLHDLLDRFPWPAPYRRQPTAEEAEALVADGLHGVSGYIKGKAPPRTPNTGEFAERVLGRSNGHHSLNEAERQPEPALA